MGPSRTTSAAVRPRRRGAPFDEPRTRQLLWAARTGDRAARDRIVGAYVPHVRRIASGYRDLGVPLDDLAQEGAIGLLRAIDDYDPRRSRDFDAYARLCIRRAIRAELTAGGRLIRLPPKIVERRRALDRAEATLAAATGRAPTPAQLARATALSAGAVREARSAPTCAI